jgi:hypothetical protein
MRRDDLWADACWLFSDLLRETRFFAEALRVSDENCKFDDSSGNDDGHLVALQYIECL